MRRLLQAFHDWLARRIERKQAEQVLRTVALKAPTRAEMDRLEEISFRLAVGSTSWTYPLAAEQVATLVSWGMSIDQALDELEKEVRLHGYTLSVKP